MRGLIALLRSSVLKSQRDARQRRLKVEFRDLVTMSTGLANVVDRLLEPAPEDRFQVILGLL
jgi:hypothetical protein